MPAVRGWVGEEAGGRVGVDGRGQEGHGAKGRARQETGSSAALLSEPPARSLEARGRLGPAEAAAAKPVRL